MVFFFYVGVPPKSNHAATWAVTPTFLFSGPDLFMGAAIFVRNAGDCTSRIVVIEEKQPKSLATLGIDLPPSDNGSPALS